MKLNRWTGACAGVLAVASLGSPPGRSRRRPTPRTRASASSPGLRDAGTAARGMELVANLPKPEGFFDPGGAGRAP